MSRPTQLTSYVSEKVAAKVRKFADAEKRSISYMAGALIEEAIEAREVERLGLSVKPERRKA